MGQALWGFLAPTSLHRQPQLSPSRARLLCLVWLAQGCAFGHVAARVCYVDARCAVLQFRVAPHPGSVPLRATLQRCPSTASAEPCLGVVGAKLEPRSG